MRGVYLYICDVIRDVTASVVLVMNWYLTYSGGQNVDGDGCHVVESRLRETNFQSRVGGVDGRGEQVQTADARQETSTGGVGRHFRERSLARCSSMFDGE